MLNTSFTLGEHRIDPGGNQICRSDKTVPIEPKAMAVLCELAANAGETVSRETLLSAVWPGRVVVEETLTRAISQLRTALQDEVASPRYIQTVPKQGYRLIGQVGEVEQAAQTDFAPEEHQAEGSKQRSPIRTAATVLFLIGLVGAGLLYWLSPSSPGQSESSDPETLQQGFEIAPAKPSVAVLPFRNLSPDAESEYFAEGIAEELLTALAGVEGLRVPSRRSSFAFKGTATELADIAGQLHVRHVLEGSVRRSADTLRISAQLIDVGTDSIIWSQQYDRRLESIFTVQEEIADAVIAALKGTLLGSLASETRIAQSASLEAYNHYLQGQYWWMNGQVSSWFYQATGAFERAIELDPEFADAHAALAFINARFNFQDNYLPEATARPRAERAIETALALDDTAVDAYFARAILATADGDYPRARASLDTAISLSPSSSVAQYLYSEVWLADNQPAHAVDAAARALDLDPLSPWANVNMGIVLYSLGRWDEAASSMQRALSIDPEYSWAHMWLAAIAHARGHLAQAVKAMHQCLDIDPSSETSAAYLGQLYLELGDTTRAQRWFEYAASLLGDSSVSRLWRRYIPLVHEQRDPDIFLELARDSLPLETATYSLVPQLHTAFAQTDGASAGIAMFDAMRPLLQGESPVVSTASARTAATLVQLLKQEGDLQRAEQLLEASEATAELFPILFAWQGIDIELLALRGRDEEAIATLKRNFETGWLVNWWMLKHRPAFDRLREHPEFSAVLARAQSRAEEQRQLMLQYQSRGELGAVPDYGND